MRGCIISTPFPSCFLAFALRFAALLFPGGCRVLVGEPGVRSGGSGRDERRGQAAMPASDPLILSKRFSSTSEPCFPWGFTIVGCCSRQVPLSLLGDARPGCPAAEGAGAGAAVTDGAVAALPAQLLTTAAVSRCSSIDFFFFFFFSVCLCWRERLGQIHHSAQPRQSELSRQHLSPFPCQESLQTVPPEHTLAHPL